MENKEYKTPKEIMENKEYKTPKEIMDIKKKLNDNALLPKTLCKKGKGEFEYLHILTYEILPTEKPRVKPKRV